MIQVLGVGFLVRAFRSKSTPPLARAIDACRKHKAWLVIAKLDRLS
jgi:hypothetical protein